MMFTPSCHSAIESEWFPVSFIDFYKWLNCNSFYFSYCIYIHWRWYLSNDDFTATCEYGSIFYIYVAQKIDALRGEKFIFNGAYFKTKILIFSCSAPYSFLWIIIMMMVRDDDGVIIMRKENIYIFQLLFGIFVSFFVPLK